MPALPRLHRAAERPRGWRTALGLTIAFAALTLIVRYACTDQAGNSSIWPANAAIVVAILVLPRRLGALTVLSCLALNYSLNAIAHYSALKNIETVALNGCVSMGAGLLTRMFCGASLDLSRFRRIATFVLIAFVAAGGEAFIGFVLQPHAPRGTTPLNIWVQWTLCDALGLVLATPALLMMIKRGRAEDGAGATQLEGFLLLACAMGLATCAFAFARLPLYLMIYPLLVLVAFRAGPAWVLTSVVLVSLIVSGLTTHGHGPLVVLSADGRLFRQDLIQPYLVSLFLATIPANSALGEKTRVARRLGRMKATMEHGATHDLLTTLVNRKLFQRRLSAMLHANVEKMVLLIDLDRFKQINDSMGHEAGDELLRLFSARLVAAAPPGATVARFGGDEFAILAPCGDGSPSVEAVCGAINAAARAPFPLSRGPAHVSASIGVARSSRDSGDAHEMMRHADIALYAAKAAGRDNHQLFSADLDRIVQERAELEADLRAALADGCGGLALHYQIKVDTRGVVRGVEALVRWRHPRLGMIAPARFIPLAEESGMIVQLGAWILQEATRFAERWPQLHVAINVSPVQLRQPEFVAETLAVLRASAVAADRIEIEVTESALLDELHPSSSSLAVLRDAGLKIALDDFGTGYSSLRHLHRFAVDRVKIDQSFVRGLGESAESAAIIQAIVQLGHAMGLQVTAEGVESEDQRRHLAGVGVDELQGYLFSRPLDENALAALMDALDEAVADAA